MLARRLADHHDTPVDDKIVVLRGATWGDYQRVIEMRGEVATPRVAFLEGALEIMTPSREHEGLKFNIGRLLEVWCLESGVEFSGYGSWTLESPERDRGVEPDECSCYVFGDQPEPSRPDLAIDVVGTSGGIDKLEIYRKLGVREVWFCVEVS
ncbi:MAG TPA: Uma2 family endonuclease [Polyangiaceae bacterium]|nr:Uma2 family endonuclease [Polyangiaceae bacterium]